MQLETQEFRAEAKFQRVSPQKARLVLELIKGRRVGDALETVAFTKKGVAPLVEKVLRAAIQNANYLSQERDLDVDVDNLYVKTALANEGPRMKRIRPAPMGRAFRYQRRMAHIVIAVAERKRAGLVETAGSEAAPAKKRTVEGRGGKEDCGQEDRSQEERSKKLEEGREVGSRKLWDKKFILTAFDWVSTSHGGHAGSSSATTTSC